MSEIRLAQLRKAMKSGVDGEFVLGMLGKFGMHISHEPRLEVMRGKVRESSDVRCFVLRDDEGNDLAWHTYRDGERSLDNALANVLADAWAEIQRRRALPWCERLVSVAHVVILAALR